MDRRRYWEFIIRYFGSRSTDKWVARTLGGLLNNISDAVISLEFERAARLLETAHSLAPENSDVAQIEILVRKLQEADSSRQLDRPSDMDSSESETNDQSTSVLYQDPLTPPDTPASGDFYVRSADEDAGLEETQTPTGQSTEKTALDNESKAELVLDASLISPDVEVDSAAPETDPISVSVEEEPEGIATQELPKAELPEVVTDQDKEYEFCDLDRFDEGAQALIVPDPDRWRVGLDFGTSNTRLALSGPDADVFVLNIGEPLFNPRMMPSAVAIHATDELAPPKVGEEALEIADDPEWRLVRHIKRLLVVESDPQDASVLGLYAKAIRNDFAYVAELPGSWDARSIATLIINEALKRAQAILDDESDPRGLPKLDIRSLPLTFGIWAAAGLEAHERTAKIINNTDGGVGSATSDLEPALAAQSMFHFDPIGSEGISVIFDLGGGTFDVCVVQVGSDENVSILAADSVPIAGGSDIERSIFTAVVEKLASLYGRLPDEIFDRLTDNALIKESLENQIRVAMVAHSSSIDLDHTFRVGDFLNESDIQVRLTSSEFSNAILESKISYTPGQEGNIGKLDLFVQVLECLRACVLRARNTVRHPDAQRTGRFEDVLAEGFIDRVVLVGGASQFPEVEQVVSDYLPGVSIKFDNDINAGINPLFAIVRGAALTDANRRSIVLDRPSYSLKIQGAEVYKARSSTFTHAPNQLSGGITAKEFAIEGPLPPGSTVTLTDERGEAVVESVTEERIHDPYTTFMRLGQFAIWDRLSLTKHVISIPNRSPWQLNHQKLLDEREQAAQQAKDDHLIWMLRTNRIH